MGDGPNDKESMDVDIKVTEHNDVSLEFAV